MIRNPPAPDLIRRRGRTLFVGIAFAALTGLTPAHAAEPAKSSPLLIDEMRAVAYTQEFAKRFALPDPEPGTEPNGGIQAMEFAVEPGAKHGSGFYYCKLKVYLNNNIPIAYPEGGAAGYQGMLIFSPHFFVRTDPGSKRQPKLSLSDGRHFDERRARYTNHVWLATPDYPGYFEELPKKPYAAVGMFYEEYHRDLFPGLAYLKIDMGCPAYSWVDKVDVIQLWLKRDGARDYSREIRKDPQDFHKFTIPQPFYRKIIVWTKRTAEYNRPLIKQFGKKQSSN